MSPKLGRNDPCWCGSGKKFKKCHIDRASQEAARPWEVDAHFRKRTEKGSCLYVGATPGTICGKPAIGSHTVIRKMLKQIARKGHVYHEGASIQDLEKTGGKMIIKEIGVNDASVLPIFCEEHDSGAFAPLEQFPFTGSQEQCALLAYRALGHELAKKQLSLNSVPVLKGFAWHDSSDASCRPLAASLDALTDEELPHAVVRFVSEFCENRYFKPDWWDGVDQKTKDALTSRFQTSVSSDKLRAVNCLADDGVRAVSWKVTGRAWL